MFVFLSFFIFLKKQNFFLYANKDYLKSLLRKGNKPLKFSCD